MRFQRSFIQSIAYEVPSAVVTSRQLEDRLEPLYQQLRIQPGSLEALTGIRERRYWPPGQNMHEPATRAARAALAAARVSPADVGVLVYAGVCRDQLEPATACAVADGVGVGGDAAIYDVSNACLGVVNGILQVASAIELGHVSAGLVVSCESARQIVDITIGRLLSEPTMDNFRLSLATLTGGSGAAAVVVVSDALARDGHRIVGGVLRAAPEHHRLCRWGPDTGVPATSPQVMRTDSLGVLQHGVALGLESWKRFLAELAWDRPDKIICHQVGAPHREQVLRAIGVSPECDYVTFDRYGNIGTVSLPLTAAMASESGFFQPRDRVGLLGIGSGLNCLLLGVKW
ncbi:MAG: 3-oxoacyl-[acyl-carrier-protein] synthase 3 [Phycisphaerae bacterium]|nr:3-oxoacyl-[acyl-carrier-protein] synthase 3 [Phycisphaerae bacterium]